MQSLQKRHRRFQNGLDGAALRVEAIIDAALQSGSDVIRPVATHLGNAIHIARIPDVLYLGDLGLQIIERRIVPTEGIVKPWNLSYLQRVHARRAAETGSELPYASAFEAEYIDEEVCILSNVFSTNFTHFTEELLKVVALERAGVTPRYVYTNLPPFAFDFWDALGLSRARLLQVPREPIVFRAAYYATAIEFGDLSRSDIFFELRERLYGAAAGIRSPYGQRLWLERGAKVADAERGVVNDDEIAGCLEAYGFTRLDIGSLPVREQVAAARDAAVMAGPHGSAFTHIMFMPPCSTMIEAFSPFYLNHCYGEICRVLRHRHAMLVGFNVPHGPYPYGKRVYVPPEQLRFALEQLD
jgi:capsular polysaccharide biosynthesis protein